ncbi:SGNH/GDSL hydrolase family protein [Burkholderia catarinensis]|uniref:SGNH/GDSL hydrolase family protein n=1 Tax=Burkholderia catarinensis TaxID=1108140 RepID=UPI000A57DF4D|nr:SGNH/GDSL hydrolase family protein [Burkholderia catarinensis]KAG8148439.1 hydrolase [Burkholderia catarinensis]
MMQKTVLCYGDSNTHGTRPMTNPGALERFDREDRWTGVLSKTLGPDWRIVEEGLPARTTVHDDPIAGRHKNGLTYLRPCLKSHLPIDVVVLMLGTNDLKTRFSVTPADIAISIGVLLAELDACRAGPAGTSPQVVLMAPAPIVEIGFLGEIFQGGALKSCKLAALYEQVALDAGLHFLDVGKIIEVSPVDGVHFSADEHHVLGKKLAEVLRRLDPPVGISSSR